MLHTRIEAIQKEGLHDETKEEIGNNNFSDLIVNKDKNNITIDFFKKELFQLFKNLI